MDRRVVAEKAEWSVQGGMVSIDTLIEHDDVEHVEDAEELLVEEVSIDGLCGVY